MQEVNSYLSQETLGDLAFLQQRADKLIDDQTNIEERLNMIGIMQESISALRARKQKLLSQMQEEKTGVDALFQSLDGKDVGRSLKKLLLKRHQLEEVKAAYRLLGQSLSVVDASTVRICIDTCSCGEFLAPHYVDISLKASEPLVTAHTLPPFINMETANQILKTGVPEFINYVQHHLQAYHTRRNFVIEVQTGDD